jgi:hypothetical protein
MYLTGWRPGGKAEYRLDVRAAGQYEAALEWQGEPPGGLTFAVGTPAGHRRLRVEPGGQETPARLELPAGPTVLSVELEDAGDPDAAAHARMSAIVLRRR